MRKRLWPRLKHRSRENKRGKGEQWQWKGSKMVALTVIIVDNVDSWSVTRYMRKCMEIGLLTPPVCMRGKLMGWVMLSSYPCRGL